MPQNKAELIAKGAIDASEQAALKADEADKAAKNAIDIFKQLSDDAGAQGGRNAQSSELAADRAVKAGEDAVRSG